MIDPPAATANIYQNCNVKRALEHHAVYPPIGLAYIAAVLRESGISVMIIDARSLGLSHEEVVKVVEDQKPDFVGITVLTPQLKSAFDLSRKIKSVHPSAVLVLGGPHIHFQHREVIEKDYVDFCVRGEGEYTMMELIQAVSDGGNLIQVKGITFKENSKVIVTPDRPLIQNLNDLPFPARDLLPNHIYKGGLSIGDSEIFTSVLSSRGCPFRCHFCAASSM